MAWCPAQPWRCGTRAPSLVTQSGPRPSPSGVPHVAAFCSPPAAVLRGVRLRPAAVPHQVAPPESDNLGPAQQQQQQAMAELPPAPSPSLAARAQPTPKAAAAAVGASQAVKQRLSECPVCGGGGRVACRDCGGSGILPRGGYSKRNPLNISRAIGSKWTAMTPTLGWRHFRVTAVKRMDRGRTNSALFLLLQASCDGSAQLWVNAQTLRHRGCFAAGWLQLSELGGGEDGAPLPAPTGKCHTCAGLGYRPCPACDGRGLADLVEL